MKKLILAASVLFAVNANAQGAPPGCYVTYDNPSSCYPLTIGFMYASRQDNINRYGWLVGNLAGDLQGCIGQLSAATTAADNCGANYYAVVGVNQVQEIAISKLSRQIKTLKRKCGSRCR